MGRPSWRLFALEKSRRGEAETLTSPRSSSRIAPRQSKSIRMTAGDDSNTNGKFSRLLPAHKVISLHVHWLVARIRQRTPPGRYTNGCVAARSPLTEAPRG